MCERGHSRHVKKDLTRRTQSDRLHIKGGVVSNRNRTFRLTDEDIALIDRLASAVEGAIPGIRVSRSDVVRASVEYYARHIESVLEDIAGRHSMTE